MPIYEIAADVIRPVAETSFSAAGVRERGDLQRLLRNQVDIVAPNTLVIAEEFGQWEDSRRRIDLLALDRDANLVVIELKRTEDGGHMELQAVRYAAMVSAMTFDNVVEVYGAHLQKTGRDADARSAILAFLGWEEPDDDRFAQDVRIVLVSADFSKEVTTAVMWLNERGLDIRCVRMKPYADGARVLVDVQQVIPLPEAADYIVKIKEKEVRERSARRAHSASDDLARRFFAALHGRAAGKTDLHANANPTSKNLWANVAPGASLIYGLTDGLPRVELYLANAPGRPAKEVFDRLHGEKEAVERRFGGALIWDRMEGQAGCRVRATLPGESVHDETGWGVVHDRMIDLMLRLEAAVLPTLDRVTP